MVQSIGIISPWNYPFSIPATETIALCGGLEIEGRSAKFQGLRSASHIDKLVFARKCDNSNRLPMLPVVLELGGEDPMVVLDDADVDVASSQGRFRECRSGLSVRWSAVRFLYRIFCDGGVPRRPAQWVMEWPRKPMMKFMHRQLLQA